MDTGLGADTPISSSQIACNEDGGTVICGLGILNSNEGAIVTIKVEPIEVGILNNKAEASYEGAEAEDVRTKASESTTVIRVVDLAVTKAKNPATPVPGQEHKYIYIVTNNGPSDASVVTLIDALPTGVRFIDDGAGSIDCNENGGIVRCDLDRLLRGDSVTVTIPVTVDPSVTGTLTNTVFVVANEADLDLSNNTVRELSSVVRSADLSLTKSHAPRLATRDNSIAYTFTAANNGPSDASGVTITDTMPEGMAYVSFTGGAQNCEAEADIVTCLVGNLAAEESATMTMFFTHTSDGTVTNTARVSAAAPDPISENNAATESVDFRFVPTEPETPEATSVPEPTEPSPTPIPERPSEDLPPGTPEGGGRGFNWIYVIIAIGGGIILAGGARIIFLRRRRRRGRNR